MIDNNYRKVEGMLYNYKKTQAEIENLKLKIKEVERNYNGVGAISYGERSSPTNAFSSSVENEVTHRDKEIRSINDKIEFKSIQLEKIDNAVGALEARDKSIIYMRYFEKNTNREIAAKLDLTEVHVCRLKKIIINELIPVILN